MTFNKTESESYHFQDVEKFRKKVSPDVLLQESFFTASFSWCRRHYRRLFVTVNVNHTKPNTPFPGVIFRVNLKKKLS